MFRATAFVVTLAACALSAAAAAAQTPTAPAAGAPTSAVDTAKARAAAGDLSGATAVLAPYVAAHPADAVAARYLGDLYYRNADVAAAVKAYLGALQAAPNDRMVHDRLGVIYASQDRVADAIDQFTRSLPEADAYQNLVELHRRVGDLASFEAGYAAAAQQSPVDPGALFAYGVVLHAERKNTEAIPYLERAHLLSQRSCPVDTELGSAYLDVGSTDSAIAVFHECLKINPNDYATLVNLSDAYDPVLDEKHVRPLLEQAEAIAPDRPEALVNLGYLADAGGRLDEAVAYYRKAVDVDPLWRDAYVNLGYDYEEHGMFGPAQAVLLKGLSVSPNDGRLHFILGVTYSLQGKRDLARVEFRSAQDSDEPDVASEARHQLASAF